MRLGSDRHDRISLGDGWCTLPAEKATLPSHILRCQFRGASVWVNVDYRSASFPLCYSLVVLVKLDYLPLCYYSLSLFIYLVLCFVLVRRVNVVSRSSPSPMSAYILRKPLLPYMKYASIFGISTLIDGVLWDVELQWSSVFFRELLIPVVSWLGCAWPHLSRLDEGQTTHSYS